MWINASSSLPAMAGVSRTRTNTFATASQTRRIKRSNWTSTLFISANQPNSSKKLEEVARATGGMALSADTPERLRAALVRTIEIEPVLGDIRTSTEIL